jgi:LDH2 family malate/lactate/ureidoglycolate dehydrogenase
VDSVTVGHPTNQTRVRRQRNDRVTFNTVVRRATREREIRRKGEKEWKEREKRKKRGGEISLKV